MACQLITGDCMEIMRTLAADSVQLCFFSPPYEDARSYSIGFRLKGQAYVDWLVGVFQECLRVCEGLVACVIEGRTSRFRYSCVPALLMADLHRAGVHLRKPPAFHRVGIAGGGGPDWLRNDYEFVVCASRPGKLPWSDNTAMGHPPKWAPGGEMSHRLTDGTRRNQWGGTKSSSTPCKDGSKEPFSRPSHKMSSKGHSTRGYQDGDTKNDGLYTPPVLANPGNVIKLLVGGGNMGGDEFSSQNEAPFPEALAEFFVLSFCRPGGLVLDPFSGSGTTAAVATRWGRDAIGIDLRETQTEIARRRLAAETPMMFT